MTCGGCQRIRRVLGIKRRVGVDGVNPDKGLFADGLTMPQRIYHVSLALIVLAAVGVVLFMTGVLAMMIIDSAIGWLISIVPTGAVT